MNLMGVPSVFFNMNWNYTNLLIYIFFQHIKTRQIKVKRNRTDVYGPRHVNVTAIIISIGNSKYLLELLPRCVWGPTCHILRCTKNAALCAATNLYPGCLQHIDTYPRLSHLPKSSLLGFWSPPALDWQTSCVGPGLGVKNQFNPWGIRKIKIPYRNNQYCCMVPARQITWQYQPV